MALGKAPKDDFNSTYKRSILFNKNLIISSACSIFISALLSQIFFVHLESQISNLKDSIFTLLIECGISTPVFALLYYSDNGYRYPDPVTGKTVRDKLWDDIQKLITAFSISLLAFSVTKISILSINSWCWFRHISSDIVQLKS